MATSPSKPNLVLIGYRGSGKTTVGRAVARRLGYHFVDTDDLVVRAAGRTIAEIFEQEGEAGFRDREARAVEQVAGEARTVISVGGGAVVRHENVARLQACGTLIWLSVPPEALSSRISSDAGSGSRRPPLTGQAGIDEIRRVLAAREPLYRAAADRVVDASGEMASVMDAVIRGYLSPG